MRDDNLLTILRAAEIAVLDAQRTVDVDAIAALLADDFEEIGSGGKHYDRAGVLHALASAAPLQAAAVQDFSLRRLAPDLALTRFRTVLQRGEHTSHSMRSSLWRREPAGWRIVFHQGTPCP